MGNGRICIRSVSRWIGIGIGGLENFCGAQVRGMLLLELMEGCVSNSGNALSHSFLFNLLKAGTLSYCCIHPFIWNWQFLRRDCEETVVDELSPLAKVPISSGEWCLLHEKPCLPSLPKEPEHSCHFLQDRWIVQHQHNQHRISRFFSHIKLS